MQPPHSNPKDPNPITVIDNLYTWLVEPDVCTNLIRWVRRGIKNFLASQISIVAEPFQRTDISTKPLGSIIVIVIVIIIICCVVASFLFFLFLQAKGREIRMNTALYDCLDSII